MARLQSPARVLTPAAWRYSPQSAAPRRVRSGRRLVSIFEMMRAVQALAMTRAATDAATMIKPMIVARTMTIRAICNEEAEAPAGKVAEAPPSH